MQKTYQQLQHANLEAAKIIYNALKVEKAISYERFSQLYCRRPGGAHRSGSFNNLIKTTHTFLYDHGLMTREIINGLIVYVATQKCFRTKSFENATRKYQIVSNLNIDKAIKYVELNDDSVPAEFEGPVVANILGLEGRVWKYFVNSYNYQEEWKSGNTPYGLPIKYKVIGVVMNLEGSGHIKKV